MRKRINQQKSNNENPFNLDIKGYCRYHNISVKGIKKFIRDDIRILKHNLKKYNDDPYLKLTESRTYIKILAMLEFERSLLNNINKNNKKEQ